MLREKPASIVAAIGNLLTKDGYRRPPNNGPENLKATKAKI